LLGAELIELTWKSQTAFVYRAADFHLLRTFNYAGEGWGLANDGHRIFMSDGSAQIRVLNPETFAEQRRIGVHDGARPVNDLNELEYVNGEIFANVWRTEQIVRVSPQTGAVLGWIDMTGLLGAMFRNGTEDVLNGIAWDAGRKRLFVTGKLWPAVFEVRIIPASK
jgi:glutaminyl-peptide cyclotransferase